MTFCKFNSDLTEKGVNSLKLISFKAPNTVIEDLDELVRGGVYSSRSEAIRTAIRDLLKSDMEWSDGNPPASLKSDT